MYLYLCRILGYWSPYLTYSDGSLSIVSTRHGGGHTTLTSPGCARFAEILCELTKTWSSGATEWRV